MAKKTAAKKGDCFEANGRKFAYLEDAKGWLICHGKISCVPFGVACVIHCWLEHKDSVYDYTNKKCVITPKSEWYAQRVVDEKLLKKYNRKQMNAAVEGKFHWGPWEDNLLILSKVYLEI